MIKDSPPSYAALRAFAAAGRLGSFRTAAAELAVTPSAVSQHVRSVEAWVGAPLFQRGVREVRLTPDGRRLAEQLEGGFRAIEGALASARSTAVDGPLRISALPLFTQAWLIPRLGRFEALHPGLSLEIDTSQRMMRIEEGEADIGIRNLRAPAQGLLAYKLMDLRGVPLCAPDVAKDLAAPADLRRATLIHIASRRDGWTEWLSAVGLAGLEPAGSRVFDTIPAALEAAALGQGVLLGLDPLVWDTPQAARLVTPFDAPPVSAGSYFLVHRRDDRARASVQAFTSWVRREVAADLRRLHQLAAQRQSAR